MRTRDQYRLDAWLGRFGPGIGLLGGQTWNRWVRQGGGAGGGDKWRDVNAICPVWVLTPLVQEQIDARATKDGVDDAQAKRILLAEKQLSPQFTTPQRLVNLAIFMCSPAAGNVTGIAWAVEGGWTAQ